MQQIERYGVMVLLFMLVTILVVSLWDGGDEESVPPARSSVASATHLSTPGAGGTVPRAVPAPQRETTRVPLTANSAQRGRRTGDRRSTGQDVASREPRTIGALPLAGQPPVSVPSEGARALTTPRMAGATGSSGASSGAGSTPSRPTLVADRIEPELRAEARPVDPARSDPVRSDPVRPGAAWTYEIKSGDTLQGIAARVLGDGGRWREIQDANSGLDPRRLMVGTRIALPGAPGTPAVSSSVTPAAAQRPSATSAKGSYVVQKGDVLSRIAEAQLGSSRRWREIVELNPGLDPDRLLVGATLRLPGGSAASASSSPPARVAQGESVAQASSGESRFKVR